jgi:hypothetical protein
MNVSCATCSRLLGYTQPGTKAHPPISGWWHQKGDGSRDLDGADHAPVPVVYSTEWSGLGWWSRLISRFYTFPPEVFVERLGVLHSEGSSIICVSTKTGLQVVQASTVVDSEIGALLSDYTGYDLDTRNPDRARCMRALNTALANRGWFCGMAYPRNR